MNPLHPASVSQNTFFFFPLAGEVGVLWQTLKSLFPLVLIDKLVEKPNTNSVQMFVHIQGSTSRLLWPFRKKLVEWTLPIESE